ncbi:HK97-gp10 family putative phage morphogenesis protein [Pseudophaeobacter sp. C1-32P7]|uniref:HK97-gp10 family putative phage morphogenesis protein n=1 Tax=Pseudophaeobacter sp. C1-32P7 TaxID=3098142 RepID=UPI0034D68FA6
MVQGLDRMNKRWKAIPVNARKNVRAAMEDAASDIVDEMWSRAPYLEGVLSASIGWTWGDAPAGSMVIGKVGGAEYGTMRITIYAGGGDAFYARFHEFGTIAMPANPFFFPVWRARRRRVKSRISRAMSKSLRES